MSSKEETEYMQCLELASGITKIIFCKQQKTKYYVVHLQCLTAQLNSYAVSVEY
jgi:penicillin-binding protein-related factor A (putative recombinase)